MRALVNARLDKIQWDSTAAEKRAALLGAAQGGLLAVLGGEHLIKNTLTPFRTTLLKSG
jgi:hypothetical protein